MSKEVFFKCRFAAMEHQAPVHLGQPSLWGVNVVVMPHHNRSGVHRDPVLLFLEPIGRWNAIASSGSCGDGAVYERNDVSSGLHQLSTFAIMGPQERPNPSNWSPSRGGVSVITWIADIYASLLQDRRYFLLCTSKCGALSWPSHHSWVAVSSAYLVFKWSSSGIIIAYDAGDGWNHFIYAHIPLLAVTGPMWMLIILVSSMIHITRLRMFI